MLEFILWVCGVILVSILTVIVLKKTNLLENIILSIVEYFSLYTICGGILFTIDKFTIIKTQIAVLILAMMAMAVYCIINMKMKNKIKDIISIKFENDLKTNILQIIICLLALPFVWNKFGMYGMGQDEGVYQIQAIAFMQGDCANQQVIETYDLVPAESQREYIDIINRKLVGYYLYDEQLPTLEAKDKISMTSGFYHGVPTYSAMLALWGKMFGMNNMATIQTVFYICAIFMMYYICKKLKFGEDVSCMSVVLVAFSPIVIWVTKSTLTEIFTLCLMLIYVWMLLEKEEMVLMTSFPLIAFSFFHITIYTVMPIIAVLYIVLYIHSQNKRYLYANIITTLGFEAGIYMMLNVAATYSYTYNFMPLFELVDFVNIQNLMIVIIIVGLLNILLSIMLSLIKIKRMEVPAWILRVVCIFVVLLDVRAILNAYIGEGVAYATIIGFAIMTSVVIALCAIITLLIKTKEMFCNKEKLVVALLFIYCILIYSAVLKPIILHYYYYARYLVPYVIFVVLTGGIALEGMRNKFLKNVCIALSVIVLLATIVKYDSVLFKENDDTRLEYEVLEECVNILDNANKVIVAQDIIAKCYLPLMHMLDCDVYMEYEGAIDEMSGDEELYYITNIYYGDNSWECVYANSYILSEDNNLIKRKSIIPFPTKMQQQEETMYVYKYIPDMLNYEMADENLKVRGFWSIEKDCRWTDGNSTVYCYLEPGEYNLTIKMGNIVPFNRLDIDSLQIKIYMNDNYLGEKIINSENAMEDINIVVSSDMLIDGRNELTIQSNTWSPSIFGSTDARKLGISVRKITFDIYD